MLNEQRWSKSYNLDSLGKKNRVWKNQQSPSSNLLCGSSSFVLETGIEKPLHGSWRDYVA